jgi:hypothetical protein
MASIFAMPETTARWRLTFRLLYRSDSAMAAKSVSCIVSTRTVYLRCHDTYPEKQREMKVGASDI